MLVEEVKGKYLPQVLQGIWKIVSTIFMTPISRRYAVE
jgi:hypothetical protein